MSVKKRNSLLIIGILLIIIGMMIGIIPIFLDNNEVKVVNQKLDDFINKSSIKDKKEPTPNVITTQPTTVVNNGNQDDYLLILEIPKVSLRKGVYTFYSPLNNLEKNVEILKESNLPGVEKGNVVLQAHNGTSKKSFFGKLHLMEVNDYVYIYYNGIKYTYKINKIYDVSKDGDVEIYRDLDKTTLTLITCKKGTKDRQIVIVSYLEQEEEY